MTTDLDQLLRDTLQGRAATVTDAPPVPSPPQPADRSRWLLVAATVAAVLVAGGGAAVWGLGRSDGPRHAGGGYAQTCHASLPAVWKAAFASKRVTVDGHSTSVEAVTPYGDVITWTTGDHDLTAHVGLRLPDGHTRSVYSGAPGDSVSTSVDGAHLVLSVAPTTDGQDAVGTVHDIVAVDLRSSGIRHLLRTAGMPPGAVVADKTAEVLNGVVYWAAVPASSRQGSDGVVLAYSLATGRTRTVGHASLLLSADPRGIFWAGGGVHAAGIPPNIPKVRTDGYDPVVTDGKRFAWLRADDPQLIGWSESAGDARQWRVETVTRDGIRSDPIAVSGPFVFLEPLDYSDPHVFVLDTRTGAVADSGIQSLGAGGAGGSTVAIGTRADDHAPFADVILHTSTLPELRCR